VKYSQLSNTEKKHIVTHLFYSNVTGICSGNVVQVLTVSAESTWCRSGTQAENNRRETRKRFSTTIRLLLAVYGHRRWPFYDGHSITECWSWL